MTEDEMKKGMEESALFSSKLVASIGAMFASSCLEFGKDNPHLKNIMPISATVAFMVLAIDIAKTIFDEVKIHEMVNEIYSKKSFDLGDKYEIKH